MTFEEDFPSLGNVKIINTLEKGYLDTPKPTECDVVIESIPKTCVVKHCLDKAKVKEAIDKHITEHQKLLDKSTGNDIIVNELGCRVAIDVLNVIKHELSLEDKE